MVEDVLSKYLCHTIKRNLRKYKRTDEPRSTKNRHFPLYEILAEIGFENVFKIERTRYTGTSMCNLTKLVNRL